MIIDEFLNTYSLKNKIAIITGGGAGIGKGIALEMAKAGAGIVVADINREYTSQTLAEIRAMGNKAIEFIGDVRKADIVDKLIEHSIKEMGTIDILVNNVGGLPGIKDAVHIWEMSEEMWDNVLTLNTKPLFLCTKAFSNKIIELKKQGNIVNISSLVGLVPPSSLCIAYGLAKAGIINFTTTAAADLAKFSIRVNCIAPGRIETPMTAGLRLRYPGVRAAQISLIPAGRLGKPQDIGKVAVFLASEASTYMSGITIPVSGGLTHLYTPSVEMAQAMYEKQNPENKI
jgi:NAD(P)-dependent dehydrogenase (short-subunit alcohol dehydrogenase family)